MADKEPINPGACSRRDFILNAGKTLTGGALLSASTSTLFGCSSSKSNKPVRLAVVGGNFGASFQFHLHRGCKVVAVSDLYTNRRSRLMRTYQCENAFPSLESLLQSNTKLDAIALFTPAPDHVKHAVMCLKRGLHVLSACPACMTLEEAHELVHTVEASGLHYMQAETSWYLRECIFAREAMQAGEFGQMPYMEAEYYHDKGDLARLVSDKSTRFYKPDGSGTRSWRWGFPPMLYPTHATAFLIGVTGEQVASVSAQGWGTEHPFLKENEYNNPYWNETALMLTSGGNSLRCNVFWHVGGHGVRAQWYGEDATLLMPEEGVSRTTVLGPRLGHLSKISLPDYSLRLPETMRVQTAHQNTHAFISAEFVDAVLTDRRPEVDVYRSVQMAAPGIVAHQSALTGGTRLPVPQFDSR